MPKELNDKLESKIELPNQNMKTPEPHIPQHIATVEIFYKNHVKLYSNFLIIN